MKTHNWGGGEGGRFGRDCWRLVMFGDVCDAFFLFIHGSV